MKRLYIYLFIYSFIYLFIYLFNLEVGGLPESTANFLLTMVHNVRALNHA